MRRGILRVRVQQSLLKKGAECLWLVTAFQLFCVKTDVANTLISESDKASARGRIGSFVVMS